MVCDSAACRFLQLPVRIIRVPVDNRVPSFPVLEPLVRQISVHVVEGALHIPFPVDMGLPASFLIIIEILVISFLVPDPADLSHAV